MTGNVEKQAKVFGNLLYFFAAYTLTIKYVLPVGWAVAKELPLTTYIYFWDAWWIAHIIVGHGLMHRRRKILIWAFLLSVAEIIIIMIKFGMFYQAPNLSFWHLNWLVNKCFLLVYFWVLLIWLMRKEVRETYEKS